MNSEQISNLLRPVAPTPTAQVISLGELHGDAAHRGAPAEPLLEDTNPLHSIRTRLQVCVGEAELTVGELLAAKEHQVLVLDRSVDQPIDMLLEGKVVARGQLVAVDGCFAVRITELPAPLKA
jgi:flagellar motor switch protein FliN/FliY